MASRKSALVVAAVLLVTLSGCSGVLGTGSDAGSRTIAEKTSAAMEDVETYRMTMNMSLESQRSTVDMSMSGVVNYADERMRMETRVESPRVGTRTVTQYVVGTTLYLKIGDRWQKQDISGRDVWNKSTQTRMQQRLLENSTVTRVRNTTFDGTEVMVLDVQPSADHLTKIVRQQNRQIPESASFEDVNVQMYVSSETYRVRHLRMNGTLSVNDRSFDYTMQMTMSDYGLDTNVTVPEEATSQSA